MAYIMLTHSIFKMRQAARWSRQASVFGGRLRVTLLHQMIEGVLMAGMKW